MDAKTLVRALKTPVTMLLLLAFVAFAGTWALDKAFAPVPPRAADPCVMVQVGPELKPDKVTVRVYNGTIENGLGKRFAANLRADGFRVVKIANAPTTDVADTQIVGVKADSPEVVLVRQAFKDAKIVADGRLDHSVDIVIGKNFAGWAEQPTLSVPVEGGQVCLPSLTQSTVGE